MDFLKVTQIHFIGLGGIGVSALARLMRAHGKNVQGSDAVYSQLIQELEKEGVSFLGNHEAEHVTETVDLVVYSPAVAEDNPERIRARKLSIPELSYPQALGAFSEDMKVIAVSGTHGKTTTTAMLADVLEEELSPTVIVGSLLKDKGSNFIQGSGDYFLIEACEYKRSFLSLTPHVLVITNIEEDHLDYYTNLKDIQSAFHELVSRMPKDGVVVCNPHDSVVVQVLKDTDVHVVDYTAYVQEVPKLQVPGEYNRENAAAAYAVGALLGVERGDLEEKLTNFSGTWRRFEYKGETKAGVNVYDDYAHNPTEIQATLEAFQEMYPDKKQVVVFQPHLYSRTQALFDDFVLSFDTVDKLLMAPIYAAREKDNGSISHTDLVESLQKRGIEVTAYNDLDGIVRELQGIDEESVIMTMGAGDVYRVADGLVATVLEEYIYA